MILTYGIAFNPSFLQNRWFVPQPITATNSPILPPNAIFHPSPDKRL